MSLPNNKWAKEIEAFVKGKRIEYRFTQGDKWSAWIPNLNPSWSEDPDEQYRIAPDTSPVASRNPQTPPHYSGPVTPWDLEKCMQSSGSAFVDSRRTDAIEYCFRLKGDLIGDLRKARHCLDEAIRVLESTEPTPH